MYTHTYTDHMFLAIYSYNSAIASLDIYTKKSGPLRDSYTPVFIAALVKIARL